MPIFFFLICFCFGTTEQNAVAYFFDVGQGHCFFFKSNKHNIAVLIDAGSKKAPVDSIPDYQPTEFRERADSVNKRRKHAITQAIGKLVNKTTALLCIVTHGDQDHYSWIHDILGKITEGKSLNKFLCILGGKSTDYEPRNGPKLTSSMLSTLGAKSHFVADLQLDVTVLNQIIAQTIGQHDDFWVQILNASAPNSTGSPNDDDEKNASSIVTRIQFGERSFMITGDATGATTSSILRKGLDIKSDVLLASHHGAATDGSNNLEWFRAVNPQYVIFSHGDVKEFFHPHMVTLANTLSLPKIRSHITNNHVLFYGYREEDRSSAQINHDPNSQVGGSAGLFFARTFANIRAGYRLMLTNANIFSTFTQGDICFEIPNTSPNPMDITWTKNINEHRTSHDLSDPQNIMTGYLNGTDLGREVVALDLSGCSGLFEQFSNFDGVVDPNTFSEKLTSLRYLNFNKASSPRQTSPPLSRVLQLIQNPQSQQIERLDLRDNGLGQEWIQEFREAWGYRGLEI